MTGAVQIFKIDAAMIRIYSTKSKMSRAAATEAWLS